MIAQSCLSSKSYHIALHHVCAHPSVTLCLPFLFFLQYLYCTSMHSNICLGASHLGTLDVQRVDGTHVLTEPNHKAVLAERILKRKETTGATEDPTQSQKGPRPC